jgi:hypothetical protein
VRADPLRVALPWRLRYLLQPAPAPAQCPIGSDPPPGEIGLKAKK